ncbi:MAG: hypothetical protein SFZ23_07445 [Planctomycetota bacterium]|nr:hypothetical protein [Planctomycetota bacterium]
MHARLLFPALALGLLALLASFVPAARAQGTAPLTLVNQTTPFVDEVIPGPIVYATGDELQNEVVFEGTVRVTSITVRYASTVPVNYVVRFYSGPLVGTITIPNLPAGSNTITYAVPAAQQFDWTPVVTVNAIGVRRSAGAYSLQLTRTDGTSPGTAAGHVLAVGEMFWRNLTRNRIEDPVSLGLVTFDLANDIVPPAGFHIRLDAVSVAAPLPATLSSLTPAATSVKGGRSTTLTVQLSAPAPAGGVTVALASNSTVASVPASVTIAGGARSATVPVTTSTVRRNTAVTLTARLGTSQVSTTLTVTR